MDTLQPGSCIICYEADPPPIQSGCACRGESGLAHVGCRIKVAMSQMAHRGNLAWWLCQTCKQSFTGAMQTGLSEASWSRVRDQAAGSDERIGAAGNLANSYMAQGRYAEAEQVQRDMHEVSMHVLGPEHPSTLAMAGNLALSLSHQGKYAHAEQIAREVLEVQKRKLGAEHPSTLNTTNVAVRSSHRDTLDYLIN